MTAEIRGQEGLAPLWRFLVPSLIGAFIFLCPIPGDGALTIPWALAVDRLKAWGADIWSSLAIALLSISALATAVVSLKRPSRTSPWVELFNPGWGWAIIRIIGAAIGIATFTQIGPDALISPGVGGVLLNDLAPLLIPLFLIAGLMIPLLTDYGLMEFIGTLAAPILRACFNVPGRGAVDAAASWLGSSTVGILITIEQYRAARYTGREAAIIATNFSLCSVGFAYALAATLKVESQFFAIYGTAAFAALVCALVLSRIPPLSRIPNLTIDGDVPVEDTGDARFSTALKAARVRAASGPGPFSFLRQGLLAIARIFMGLLPSLFAIGGLGLLIADATPVFSWLAMPVEPVLDLLGVPDGGAAAPALVVGVVDQFLTAIVGADVPAAQARFVIAVAAIAQLLYFSDMGAFIIQSPLPIGPITIAVLFVLRTAMIVPIAAGISHLLY